VLRCPTNGCAEHEFIPANAKSLTIGLLWLLIVGMPHFAATETEMRIVPSYIPWLWVAVIVSGLGT